METIWPADSESRKLRLLLVVGIVLVVTQAVVLSGNQFVRYRSDFFLHWYSIDQRISQGRNLYDRQNALEAYEYTGRSGTPRGGFFYPAVILAITGPLALLPYDLAHVIWSVATQLFYLLGIAGLMRMVGWPTTVNRQTLFLLAAFFFVPFLQQTIWGQFNTIDILGFVLVYRSLRKRRYATAGAWTTLLLFKPQTAVLTVFFLLFWALAGRRRLRRRLLMGFAVTSIALWAGAELFQPGWISNFASSLENYRPIRSVVDGIWNPFQLVAALLLLGAGLTFFRFRNVSSGSNEFDTLLVLSLAVWFLVVPIVGMMHGVYLPLMTILLASVARAHSRRLERIAVGAFVLIYLLGWLAFLGGNLIPGWYGLHIDWSEMAYREVAPFVMACFCLLFLFREKTEAVVTVPHV